MFALNYIYLIDMLDLTEKKKIKLHIEIPYLVVTFNQGESRFSASRFRSIRDDSVSICVASVSICSSSV